MEYIDIIHSDSTPAGYCEPRDKVHRLGLRHRTVHTWILNASNEILLQKRSWAKENYPEMWDVSSAGHISTGETSLSASLKELKEELGVIPASPPKRVFSLWCRVSLNNGTYIDHELQDVYLLNEDIPIQAMVLQQSEVAEVQYIHYQKLKTLLQSNPSSFVPHPEEYERLFSIV